MKEVRHCHNFPSLDDVNRLKCIFSSHVRVLGICLPVPFHQSYFIKVIASCALVLCLRSHSRLFGDIASHLFAE